MAINKIDKFEKNNEDIAVNVLYIYSGQKRGTSKNEDEEERTNEKYGKITILRRSDYNTTRSKIVNLLLITNGEKKHYAAVKNMSELLSRENANSRRAYHHCLNCLNGFRTESSRDKHYANCVDHDAVKIKMLWKGEDRWVQYHGGQNQFKVPFAMYADFESILKPMDECYKDRMNQLKAKQTGGSYTECINRHVLSGWCVYSKFAYGEIQDPLKAYHGKDCAERFIDHIVDETKRLYEKFPEQPMIPLTEILQREHDEATKCHICMKLFDDPENNQKVRDHCHYTGLYRGAAHDSCNLQYKIPKHIPVVFHNLSSYDIHLFIKELGKKFNTEDVGCIAENKGKYISFNVKIPVQLAKVELQFIDSCMFMASSLDKLSSNLADDQCKNLQWFYQEEDAFQLMRRKRVYPYEYMDSWERFEERKLPPKEAFFSKLNMESISAEDYEHALQVWNRVNPEGDEVTLGDYHDVYLATNVLLLADVFENFRDVCLQHYKLDPAHFYTAPGLAWQAALKYTGVKLEILTDYDMLLMFEKGIRSGITQAVRCYAKANNKYLGELYKPDDEISYLQYLDANNLYGWAMSEALPTHGFKWVKNVEEFTAKRITKLAKKNKHGYLLDVDVDYPEELHEKHNELPFLPEKMEIDKVMKLVPNLFNKKQYVVHI